MIISPHAQGISRAVSAAGAKVFRGGIAENCARFQFRGTGYAAMPAEQNGHFKIESARQIAGPLDALLNHFVRIVHVIGATQVLKSMCGDAWVIYAMEHLRRAMLVLFEDDDKAKLFCAQRLMETIRNHPVLGPLIVEVLDDSPYNMTTRKIKIPGAMLLVAGMNEGNVSTLSWPLVWVSEAWQHKNDGLLFKAFKRTDRYPDTFKILNESQASMVDEDLHTATKDAYQVPLVWICPCCGGEQTWEWRHWNHKRLIDFVPRQPKLVSSATVSGQLAEVWEQPKPGSFAGMKFGDDKDNHTVDEKSRSAYWECIWCGHRINDTRSERMAICESYRQDYKVLENGIQRTPKEVCFTIPFEAAYDNRFEKTVKNFLHAKEAKAMGNEEKMVLWFLAERAYFYDPKQMDDSAVNISVGTYETDPDKLMPNSHCRQVTVDTGKDESAPVNSNLIGLFWFDIWEWDKNSNGRQLSYGVVNSWALLAAQQRFWKVPCARTFIDCSYMPSQVEENAVKYFELIPPDPTKDGQPILQTPYAWRMAAGAGQNRRMTVPGQNRGSAYSLDNTPGPPKSTHDKNGKMWRMWVKKLTWSNLAFEKQLDSILAKGVEQQLEFIPSSKVVIVDLDGKPSEELVKWSMERCRDPLPNERGHKFSSYQSQLGSRYYKQDTNKYEDFEKQSRPTEFRDTLLMQLAGLAPDGLMGHVAINDK